MMKKMTKNKTKNYLFNRNSFTIFILNEPNSYQWNNILNRYFEKHKNEGQ